MTMDLSNFYLGTPLDRPEYVRIKLSVIPQEVIDAYGLDKYAINGWVYFEISKGMYGLKQAGKLANEFLPQDYSHGYYQCATTPGLFPFARKLGGTTQAGTAFFATDCFFALAYLLSWPSLLYPWLRRYVETQSNRADIDAA
jgi:hypothetical protein